MHGRNSVYWYNSCRRRGTEAVTTALTRNQMGGNATGVRIPPSPPLPKPVVVTPGLGNGKVRKVFEPFRVRNPDVHGCTNVARAQGCAERPPSPPYYSLHLPSLAV